MTWTRLSPLIGAALLAATVGLAQPGPMRRHAPGKNAVPPACQQMMDELKATDTRFDEAVKRMNETQGNERIDAMVAALNELAAQRHTMREHIGSMPCAGMGGGMPGGPMMGR